MKSKAGLTLARVTRKGSVVEITPVTPFPEDEAPFSSFLLPRVLAGTRFKHPEFMYSISADSGVVRAIRLDGVNEVRLKEILGAVKWTLERMQAKQEKAA